MNISNSLVDNLLYNEKRQKDSVKLFEISDIYSLNDGDGIEKKRKLSIVASGRVGLNYEDFSKKIDKKYLRAIFERISPNQTFNFNIISRDLLDTKIKNEIIGMEVSINNFSNDILAYNEISKSPDVYNQFSSISEQPSSFKDISFLIKEYSKTNELQNLLLNFKNEIIKHVYIFDYFENEKQKEIKIGFRFIFQSKKMTLTSAQIELVYNELIKKSLSIPGIEIPGL